MAKSHKKKRLEARFGSKQNAQKIGAKANSKASSELENTNLQATAKRGFYYTYYKQLLIIPFLLLVIALVVLGVNYVQTGTIINGDITLRGGTSIIVTQDLAELDGLTADGMQAQLQERFPAADFDIRTLRQLTKVTGFEISADITDEQDIVAFRLALTDIIPGLTNDEVGENLGIKGASIGASFFKQISWALLAAFILMGIVIFIQFKVPIPSLAVILAAFSDIVITLAIVNILGIKLSTAGVAAFLMLIGYSVDTDVLLSTRVLKNKSGTVYSRIISAMKIGLTMNITTLAAVTVGMIVSQSATISQIMTILFIGLWVDMINTWIQNAGILRWYAEKKEGVAK
ncbi:protein translocase subunit SecF [Candidatus Woesearchaeota archaeon]|nr:protein translocase subunit SecF [Candidatus Woesearchaeota archaeon]